MLHKCSLADVCIEISLVVAKYWFTEGRQISH
jgi:hypothetical protein